MHRGRASKIMYTDTRPPVPRTARMLEARYYVDPEVFARERARLFEHQWVFVGRTSEVARPGDYLLVEVAGESVIVVRDEKGDLRGHANLCRHRGTRLIDEPRGSLVGGAIQCPYHAWTYGLDGRLRAAPGMGQTEGFSMTDHGLTTVRVEAWDGHLFVSLGPNVSSLAEVLDDLPVKLAPWGMEALVPVEQTLYPVAANWKLVIQNYSECLHCPVAHPQLQDLSHSMSGENDPPHRAYLGGRMDLRPHALSLTEDGSALAAPLPDLSKAEQRIVAYYAVLPNLLLNLHPDYMMTFALAPRAADHTDITCTWYVHLETARDASFDPSSAVTFWDVTNRQDWALCERAQKGISSRAYRPGPYSNREELLWAFDQWVVERVG